MKIKLAIFDLDGTLTDGSLIKPVLNSKDMWGLKKLNKLNIKTAIISKSKSKITNKFLTERVNYILTDVDDKIVACNNLLLKLNLNYGHIAYIGDDAPDIGLLKKVNLSACPSDSLNATKKVVQFISPYPGGKGAVRDFIEYILRYNKLSKEIGTRLIDCSLRDGGYNNNWKFEDIKVMQLYEVISNAGIEYFEIGFRSTKLNGGGKWLYSHDEDITKIKRSYTGNSPSKIAVMLKYGEYSLEDINEASPIGMYRILIKSKDYNKAHNQFILAAIEKVNSIGKEVSLNIPCGHNLDIKLKSLIDAIFRKKLKINIFYLADTFGSMNEKIITNSFSKLLDLIKKWDDNPVFGFHPHNNNGDALCKTLHALNKFYNIKYIDSCILGQGRGSGNLKTEDILLKLNTQFSKKYNYLRVYKYIFENYAEFKPTIIYKLSGEYKVHPNYVKDILNLKLNFEASFMKIKKISKYKLNRYNKDLI